MLTNSGEAPGVPSEPQRVDGSEKTLVEPEKALGISGSGGGASEAASRFAPETGGAASRAGEAALKAHVSSIGAPTGAGADKRAQRESRLRAMVAQGLLEESRVAVLLDQMQLQDIEAERQRILEAKAAAKRGAQAALVEARLREAPDILAAKRARAARTRAAEQYAEAKRKQKNREAQRKFYEKVRLQRAKERLDYYVEPTLLKQELAIARSIAVEGLEPFSPDDRRTYRTFEIVDLRLRLKHAAAWPPVHGILEQLEVVTQFQIKGRWNVDILTAAAHLERVIKVLGVLVTELEDTQGRYGVRKWPTAEIHSAKRLVSNNLKSLKAMYDKLPDFSK